MAKILILETIAGHYDFDLHYASCVMSQPYNSIEGYVDSIASRISNLGHDVLEVISPSPHDANSAIEDFKPDAIWLVGHGNPCLVSLENLGIWQSRYGYHVWNKNPYILFSQWFKNCNQCIVD